MWKRIFELVLLGFMITILSCVTNPVTGRKELSLVSTAQEKEIGEATDQQIIQQYGLYPDKGLQRYVTTIGKQIVAHSHRPELGYEFKVVDSEVVNAFAVPGGYIYFTREILAHFNNEAQLAGVMAHEIGHIAARHSAQLITRAQLAQLGLGVVSILSEDFRKYTGLASVGIQLLFLKFSRDDERQADELGTEYATKEGYDTRELAGFFQTLDRLHPGDAGGLPGWFSTHPDPAEREQDIIQDTEEWQQKFPMDHFSIDRNDYLRRIDGIIFGKNPRHGFVDDGTFYHPDFRFRFPVPARWEVINSASQVQMIPGSQDAAILLVLSEESSPQKASDLFIERSNASVLQKSNTNVNGMSAVQLLSEVPTEQNRLRVLSYFIQKDGRIFVFHGYTSVSLFDRYQGTFQNTMTHFDHLRDRRILNAQPARLQIRRVPSDGTLRNVLLDLGTPEDKLEQLAILNGMRLQDNLKKGTLLKLVANR